MRLLSHIYKDLSSLQVFVTNNNIVDSNQTFIQVFASNQDDTNFYALKQNLQSLFPKTAIIAASTAGIISNGVLFDGAITISFSLFENSIVTAKSYCKLTTDAIVEKISSELITERTKLLVCFASPFSFNSEDLLKKITRRFPSIIIAGGNAADDYRFQKTSLYSSACKECDVAFAAIDSDVLQVHTKQILNWHTIGKELLVTKSEGTRLYELNDMSTLDVYEYYLGKEIRDSILTRGTEFPLIFEDGNVNVARAPVATHEDGSLTLAGELTEGIKVKFGYANIESIEEYNQKHLLNEYTHKNEALYIYTCAARRSMLGNYLNQEISLLNAVGPTTGFVTYGEFFHDESNCANNLLNITTTYVVLNESQKATQKIEKQNLYHQTKDAKSVTLKALTTLVSRTSEELDENIFYLEQFKKAVNEVAILSRTNKEGIIQDVNENFELISGYKKEELIGKSHNVIRHHDMPDSLFKDMWRTIESGKIWKGIVKNQSKDAKAYYVLSEISPIYHKDGSFREYIGIRNDVTELEEYKTLLKNELDTTSHNLEDNLNYTTQYEEAINSTTAILKTDTNNIIKYANNKFCILSGYTLQELIGKSCSELRHEKHRTSNTCHEIQTKLSHGMIVRNILTNIAKDGSEYTVKNLFYPIKDRDGNFIESLQIMYNITELLALNEEIINTQKEVVLTMGAIGETRSKETGLHVKRVAEYSYLLAKLAKLSEEEAALLKQASPMHDIGKVGIPDNILNKPGKLTPEEFEIMKQHAVIGYEMLKHSQRDILKASSIVAYTHHEKWNGTGYPNGLNGEDIHIFGRITAIADVFDALGHNRVYKKAWKLEAILELFQQERGKHFDPNLVDLFFENLEQFLEIKNTLDDKIIF